VFFRLWFWTLALLLASVSLAFYLPVFYPGFQVKNIVILGNDKIKTQDLERIVLENANTGLVDFGWLKIISRSIFLVDLQKIDKEILDKFPVIESIKTSKNLPQTLAVDVAERKAVGIYCPLASSEQPRCFLIDQNGVVFEPEDNLQQGLVIVRQAIGDPEVFTGENVIQKSIMETIYKIEKNLEDKFQINLREALIASSTKLDIKTSENWQVYFDLSESADINMQITKLDLLLEKEISSENRKNLRYINLIPKDRAIICANPICGE